jgi:hypothetical protein
MKSYKNWKLVNESLFPLGLSQPNTVGGVVSNAPAIAESSKKAKEETESDDDCSCKKDKVSKKVVGEKKKKMDGDVQPEMLKKRAKPDDEDMEDDEEHDDDDHDDHDDDEEDDVKVKGKGKDDDDHDDDEEDDADEEDGDDGDDDDGDDDDGSEMEKYGFMKKKMKKMKKKMKKMQAEAAHFEKDLSSYPDVPQDHSEDSEEEFWASLDRLKGNPNQRFSSGLSEDMLVPLNDPTAPDYEAPEPGPGEVGYAPQGRMGVIGSYSESTEFSTLCKYLGEEAARKLYKGKAH